MNTFTDRPAFTPCPLKSGDMVMDRMAGLQQSLAGASTPVSS